MTDAHSPLGDDDTLAGDDGVAAARPPDALRAGAAIGRYLVIEPLGAGGMGVVWSAYDPELDRKVAIKLLHADMDGSRGHARLLREAQAMARLAHPNVITVHDVGTHDEAVFVAMELVRGWTLTAWLRRSQRTWGEILAVLVDAARGVVAAHAAGLVHRDLKPDNIMIGEDGRVRVMDFGLARAGALAGGPAPIAIPQVHGASSSSVMVVELTQAGALLGTPAYMPPEQYAGKVADARGDQFSFCVTAWESLYGERPFRGATLAELASRITRGELQPVSSDAKVPRWIARVLVRGLATDPAARFGAMDDLLDALRAGRRRAQMRLVAIVGTCLAVAGVAGFAIAAGLHRQRLAECTQGATTLARTWPGEDGEVRREIAEAFARTQLDYAEDTRARVQARLDDYVAGLSTALVEVCEAEVDHTRDDVDAVRSCLDQRRSGLAALIDDLRGADASVVQLATTSVLGLPAVAECVEAAAVARRVVPTSDPSLAEAVARLRERLEVARSHRRTGRFALAEREAEAALEAASALGWPALTAEAHELVGGLAKAIGDYERGERELVASFTMATAAGHEAVAIGSANELVDLVGNLDGRLAEGTVWATMNGALVQRGGDGEGLRDAAYHAVLGNLEYAKGNVEAAEHAHRRALTLHTALLGPQSLEVANGHARLGADALARGDATAAGEQFGQAIALLESLLGPSHPELAMQINGLGASQRAAGDLAAAEQSFERARGLLERALGPDAIAVAHALSNVALVRRERGDAAGARAEFVRSLAILERALGPEHIDVATVHLNLGLLDSELGDDAGAERAFLRSLEIREQVLGVDHPAVAKSLMALAGSWIEQGRASEAVPSLERSLRISNQHAMTQGEIGAAELLLADALWQTQRDDVRAIELAEAARARFAGLDGAQAAKLAHVLAWQRAHPVPRVGVPNSLTPRAR